MPTRHRCRRTTTFGPDGRLQTITDGDGHTATLVVGPSLRTEALTDATGNLTTIVSLDALGDVVQQDQIAGGADRMTSATYDAQGRELTSTNALGKTTTNTYNAAGDLASTTDPLGRRTTYTYDAADHLLTKTLPSGAVAETDTYDSKGNLTSLKQADGAMYTYAYNSAGQPTALTDPLGHTVAIAYDASGHPTSSTDASGNTTQIQVSTAGLITSTTDPLGGVTSYTYDNRGDVTSTTNALGEKTTYAYDASGNSASSTDPLGRTTQYAYDPAGLMSSVSDRNGNETAYTYDEDGRLTKTAYVDGTSNTFGYDGFGELTSAINSTETLGFGYDSAGNVVSATAGPTAAGEAEPAVMLHYTYDAAGDATSVSGPAGVISYGYNPDSVLNMVTDPAGGVFNISHDGDGRETSLSRPNGVSDAITYDGAGELTAIDSTTSSGSSVGFDHYAYTTNGLRASLATADGSTSYAYDADGQLTSATYPSSSGLANESFAYDTIGDQNNASQAYDGAGRLTADAKYTYVFDKEGQLTSRTTKSTGKVAHFVWNLAHQLVSYTGTDGVQTTFAYDPIGRRVDISTASTRVHTIFDGQRPIADYNSAGSLVASYVYGAGNNDQLEESTGGSSYYYLHDALGSVTALTDASGSVVDSYRYGAFGTVRATGTVANPFTYVGARSDSTTGLVYLSARYLDPTIGRFISEDPVPGAALYPYALDDPTDLSDPSGRTTIAEEGAAEDIEGQLDSYSNQQYLNLIAKAAQRLSSSFLSAALGYETAIHAPQLYEKATQAEQWILAHPAAATLIIGGIGTAIGGAAFAILAGGKFFDTVATLDKEGETVEAIELSLKAGIILANIAGIAAGGIGLIVDGVCNAIGGDVCDK